MNPGNVRSRSHLARVVFSRLGVAVLVAGTMIAISLTLGLPKAEAAGAQKAPAWWSKVKPADKAWAKKAKLGPYAEAKPDWARIERLAKKEGEVVVYSQSSRIKKAAAKFEKKYPYIKVVPFDMYVSDLVNRWTNEQSAGVHSVDVIFAGDEAMMINKYFVPPQKQIWNFVPPEAKKTWISSKYYNPLLIIRVSLQPIFYNPGTYSKPPISNLWDLTKPEWSRRMLIMDPTVDPFALNWLTTIVQHSDELATAYKEDFGKDLKLDAGIPNAGYQWLKDFMDNHPIIVSSDDKVAEGVGAKGSKHLGLAAFYSKYRWTLQGRVNIYPIHNLKPFSGTQTFTYLGISDRAPHPNAAKLFIREMVGNNKDKIGIFFPWNVPGDFKPRVGISPPKGMPEHATLESLITKYRPNDPTFIYHEGLKIRDFWTANFQN
jgi:iron(III) transport system substrate-binding protein